MDLVRLEVGQQVVDLFVLGDEIGFADQLLPREIAAVVDVGQQVLDVERPADIVHILLVDRDAREARFDDRPLDRLVIGRHGERRDVHTGFHNLLHFGIDEVDDARKHHVLLGAGTLRHVDGVGQFVERNLALVRGLFTDAAARADQRIGERIENPPQHQQRTGHHRGEAQGNRLRQHFGQYLAEKQQQESHQHGLEQELEPQESEDRVDDPGREDDDADIHQIVDHQDRGQQQVDVRQQPQHGGGRCASAALQMTYIIVREGEKRSLGPRNERRNTQQAERHRAKHGDMG